MQTWCGTQGCSLQHLELQPPARRVAAATPPEVYFDLVPPRVARPPTRMPAGPSACPPARLPARLPACPLARPALDALRSTAH